ncbi:LPS assembly lipoprotein LptE [Pontibacterium granulatum]|uniref:LPS-assembly lipoprotein LptE n=1 Tax=Pontibacterium granulatum TaxID=2036029 RepID=UPI00249A4E58|nr:LPS assembly lipoprotein LptE [Pontibacterium granulatum]MDI3323002.1 LPS assembly lipoprotein LptE [Pontibacterium granulatum]
MALQLNVKPLLAITLAFTLSLLSACGFHLRGAVDVSADKLLLSLQDERAGERLSRSLKRSLQDNGVQLTADAPYNLKIDKSRFSRESVSLDSSARVDEYSLTLTVNYTLHSLKSDLTKTESAIIERVYTYDADDAAAKDEQETLLRNEMYDAMATRIIRSYMAFDSKK